MTTRHTMMQTSGEEAAGWLEAFDSPFKLKLTPTDFVQMILEDGKHEPSEEGDEVGSYDPDDVLHDVFLDGKHYVLAINRVDVTVGLEEVRGE